MRIVSFFSAIVVLSSILSTAQASSIDGLFVVTGHDKEKGSYQGFIQIKDDSAIRIVRYSDYEFMGNKVETVWTGHIQDSTVEFKLKPSETLTGFNDFRISEEEMKNPVTVHQEIDLERPIELLNGTETWTLFSADPGEQPLWKDERTKISTNGNKANFLLKVINLFGIKKVIQTYQELAAKSRWADKPDFKNKQHWAIVDHTDFDFYQQTPNVIRVTNKTINPVSLAEATARKNAYGKKLSEKAAYFENETKSYNVNSQGMLEVAIVDENRNKVSGEVEYDSTLWTGMYIWAEVLRYKQTQDPEAYENIKKSLQGILLLTKITGDPNNFARTVIESPASEKPARDGLVQGKGNYSHLKWQQIGNNDMTKGLFISFISVFPILKKEDADLKKQIAAATKRMLQYAPIKGRGFNEGIAYGLVALYNKDKAALETYSTKMNNLVTFLADAFDVDSGFYYESIADWSGIHLSTVSTMSDILLARELQKQFTYNQGSYLARRDRKQAENRMYEMSLTYKKAKRDFLTILAYAYSPEARRSKELKALAQSAVWSLREVPAPRSIGKGEADHMINPDWSISAWPKMPWKSLKGPFRLRKENLTLEYHMQGNYMYPIFESTAWHSTYFWKDQAYHTQDMGQANRVSFSADYLILYRVAIDAGLITPQD